MRLLAIDTATPKGSVAIVEGDAVLGEIRMEAPDRHSRRLVPAVSFLMDSLEMRPADIEGYAVTTGPGSFTGLRVGISTVQGLALASGRPCLGIPALDVLAARIVGSAETLVAMMNAFRGEVFGAVYDAEGRLRGSRVAEAPETFLERLPAVCAFIGDGVDLYRPRILARRPGALFPLRSLFLAGTLGRLAAPRFAAGEGVGPEALRPLYLREADIRKGPAPETILPGGRRSGGRE